MLKYIVVSENISLIVAFGGGLLAFLSPCVLPMVPVYLVSICGPGILEPTADRSRVHIFFNSLSFVIGFSLVFIALGAVAGLAGFAFGSAPVAQKIAGSLLVAFGLFILGTLKFPWLNYEKRINPSLGNTTGYLRSLLIGAIFSLGWTPCIAGLLGGTLGLALRSATAWQGAYLLSIFSLGLALPFLIIGLAFDSLLPLVRRIQRYSRIVYIVSGLLLIAVGILVLTGTLGIVGEVAG
jgi:cytochrome c-type biogenesis protein